MSATNRKAYSFRFVWENLTKAASNPGPDGTLAAKRVYERRERALSGATRVWSDIGDGNALTASAEQRGEGLRMSSRRGEEAGRSATSPMVRTAGLEPALPRGKGF